MENAGAGEEASRQLQVRFVTKLPPPLKVPSRPIAVPSALTRMGLSEIVNHLLGGGDSDYQPQPFDFMVNGELVRMSLEEFLLAKGISAEKVLEIEYIKAVAPRRQHDPCLHDDWVSAVDGSNKCFILTGCYDSFARIWKDGTSCTHVLEGHSDAVTSLSIINKIDAQYGDTLYVGTASKDRTLRLWKLDATEPVEKLKKVRAFKVLNGHTSAVQSVTPEPSGDMVCSGSWDCSIKLWAVKEADAEGDQVSVKKRKTNSDTSFNEESHLEGAAVSTFNGHTQCVSAVVWPERQTLYSASWDHSIRRWDIPTSQNPWNLVCGKALNCLDIGGEGFALVAAGGSDPVLRVWDPRRPGTLAPVYQFSSHSSWITSCKWHRRSWFHLLSASYDGKVMLWDLRTAWPLAVIDSHTDKVLCADWWKDDCVITGGVDSKLLISSGITI
uniref:Ribosome biogenesis protein WDR12 homolog n=1 Tax=Anthurium amnicola TaxID=1678845 RepID=A0A1D1Z622_9ARAE